jgi:hypothetical protein
VRTALKAALALGLAVSAGAGESSLARLADALAQEVARQARGRPVEPARTLDRTGGGGPLALDLDALVRSRLEAGPGLASEGARVQVLPVLAEAPGRLIVSARLVEQPGARLLDIVSVSVETEPGLLALAARPPAASAGGVDLVGSTRSAPLAGRVLDLAFAGPERLLVLGEDELSLYRWDGGGLTLVSRRRFAGPLDPVRHAGGIVRAVERERSAWAVTSRTAGALLFGVEDTGLVPRQQADALPWPGSPAGLRFRPGTDLIEGTVQGLGSGPFLRLEESGAAVDREGRLLPAGAAGELRVGPTLAALWPRHLAASSAAPPGERDTVLILSLAQGAPPRVVSELPVEGAVRALAAHVDGRKARLVAAVEAARLDAGGPGAATQTYLIVFDLAQPAAWP